MKYLGWMNNNLKLIGTGLTSKTPSQAWCWGSDFVFKEATTLGGSSLELLILRGGGQEQYQVEDLRRIWALLAKRSVQDVSLNAI